MDFGENFAVSLDILKAFDRDYHESLISKLPSYGFYPSLCIFISNLLSNRSIAAVVDGHCSFPKPINSGVSRGCFLSPTVFLLFINDLLNLTQCPIHFYADDITLHFLMSYNRLSTQQELNDSRRNAIRRLTSDLSIVSDWGRTNLVLFNVSKTQFLQLSTGHNFPDNYLFFFNDTQRAFSSSVNTISLSFTKNLNWQFHISTPVKSPSKKLGVLRFMCPFFSPSQLLAPCMEYGSHVWGCETHTAFLNRVKSNAFCLINFPPLTDCLDSISPRRNTANLISFLSLFSC